MTNRYLFLFFLLGFLFPLAALGRGDSGESVLALAQDSIPEASHTYLIEGKVRQVGSSPFIRLMVEDDSGRSFFFIDKGDVESFTPLTGSIVRLKSPLEAEEIYSADGTFIATEYKLLDPELME